MHYQSRGTSSVFAICLALSSSCLSTESRGPRYGGDTGAPRPTGPASEGTPAKADQEAPHGPVLGSKAPGTSTTSTATSTGRIPAALPPTASSGCHQPPPGKGLENVSIKVGASERSFIRVVSEDYRPDAAHALVIGYHGLGLDGTSPRVHHDWPAIERQAGDEAIFIYANALYGSWNAQSGQSPDVLFFDALVDTLGAQYCLDQKRVFVHGFSNGSFFVNALVSLRPKAIRGVISVAGGGGQGRSKIAAMVIHGVHDPDEKGGVNYYPNAPNTVSAYAAANGCTQPVNFEALSKDACHALPGCPTEHPVWFCPWNGNHHWPAFSLPEVWRFIKEQA